MRPADRGEILAYQGTVPNTGGMLERLPQVPWGLVILLLVTAMFGMMVLYSAVGGKDHIDFIGNQVIRLIASMTVMLGIATSNDKFFRRYAYLFYFSVLLLLIAVQLVGTVSMGARRWLNLGFMRLQPSELMKVALPLVLARYFHDRAITNELQLRDLIPAAIIILLPVGLILKQPDLGTGMMVLLSGGVVVFVAGLSWKIILGVVAAFAAAFPLVWNMMHDYQRQRIITLFDPESDPLGAGYHIIQSKIAVGSGGILGKGMLAGSQNRLDFLPERHTDFIFSVMAEEWGFIGCTFLVMVYIMIIARGMLIAALAKDRYGLLLASGLISLFAFQAIINIGMVIGMFPVVGIPLPLVSYGGSSMVTILVSMGLIAHVHVHSKRF